MMNILKLINKPISMQMKLQQEIPHNADNELTSSQQQHND